MGNKVLLSIKHLNVAEDGKLVPYFVGPFSIVYWVGPLAYWLNLGTCHSQVHLIFYISLFKPFYTGFDGYLNPMAVYVEDEHE